MSCGGNLRSLISGVGSFVLDWLMPTRIIPALWPLGIRALPECVIRRPVRVK